MKALPHALLLAALPLCTPLPAAAQFIPLDEQEATLDDDAIIPGPEEPDDGPAPAEAPPLHAAAAPLPLPAAIITANGDDSRFAALYAAHRAFPSMPDQSAMRLLNGARVSLHNPHILKRGGSSSIRSTLSSGLNAALSADSGSWCSITQGFITTRAHGAAALFAGGDNTRLVLEGTGLSTWQPWSPGIIANNEAEVTGYGLTISTQGEESPALLTRSWAGLQLNNCRIITTNHASPALDTNADANLRDIDFCCLRSGCLRLGSGTRVSIARGQLRGNYPAAIHLRSALTDGVEGEPASLRLRHSTVMADAGSVFLVTNVSAELHLEGVTASGNGMQLLLVRQGTEGQANANSAEARLHATASRLSGDIGTDAASRADITLDNGTTWSGSARGNIALSLQAGALWNLSGNSSISSLDFGGSSVQAGLRRIRANGFTLFYKADSTPALGGKSYELPGGGQLCPAAPGG